MRGPHFTILGIDSNDLSGDALGFVRRYRITYPQLRHGKSGSFSNDQLGTTGVPESFLLDPRGTSSSTASAPVTDKYLSAERGSLSQREGEAVRRALRGITAGRAELVDGGDASSSRRRRLSQRGPWGRLTPR